MKLIDAIENQLRQLDEQSLTRERRVVEAHFAVGSLVVRLIGMASGTIKRNRFRIPQTLESWRECAF